MAFTGRRNAFLAWENEKIDKNYHLKKKRFNTDTKLIRNREEKI